MNGHTAAIIAVWVACGIVLLAIVVVIVLLLQRRRLSSRRTTKFYPGYTYTTSLELRSSPSPGAYASPLTVELEILSQTTAPGTQILVHVIPTASVSSAHSTVLGNDGFYSSSFLLYSSPLCFSEPGSYCIQAHTFNADTKVVGAVHQFIFSLAPRAPDVTSAAPVAAVGRSTEVDIALPSRPPAVLPDTLPLVPTTHRIAPRSLPPQIMPSTGEVTTATPIVMTPHPHSQTADQIRYSVDGSYPSILYTSPIFLSVPPSQLSSSSSSPYVTIKAIAVPAASTPAPAGDMTGPSSPISQVVLKVRSAGCSYLDPTVPAPSMRLRAVDAKLYFDESQNPSGTRTCYQLVSVNEARRKAKYSRKHSTLYTGVPISISEDVAAIYAWTVDEAHFMRSSGQDDLDSVTGSVDGGATRLRSVAAVYDCARASTEIVKASRSRIQDRATSLLPPPVPCISCSEMEVEFEEPPAHSVIAYTLNGREPLLNDVNPPACAALLDGTRHDADSRGLGTFLYSPSQRIHLTLLESEGAQITARIFIPINDGGVQLSEDLHGGVHASVAAGGGTGKLTGYRLGKLFHRSFFFHDAQWSCEKP